MDFFRRFFWSIMRPAAYRGFAYQSTGKALGYLAWLVLLISIPTFIYIYIDMSPGTTKLANQIRHSWPDFTLTRGRLEVNAPMPVIIDNGDGSLTIIDTRGRDYPSIVQTYPSANYVITQDHIFQRRGDQSRVIDFMSLKFLTFTKETLIFCMDHFAWLAGVTIIAAFPLLYIFKLLEAALAALFMLLLGLIIGTHLEYSHFFRISIYALTIPLIAQGLQKALLPNYHYPGILFYSLFVIYLILGLRGAARGPIVL